MKARSIRVRLTLWYFAILAPALGLCGVGAWFAMRGSLYSTIDESLRDRVRGVRKFIEVQGASLAPIEMRDEFKEHSVLGPGGDLFQVRDAQGNWLYRSAPLEDHDVPVLAPERLKQRFYEDRLIGGTPLRLLSQKIEVRGQFYTVQVAARMEELNEALARFRWWLLMSVPLVLAVALAGGYYMSRRALAPVDAITNTARSISAQNLSSRLEVPPTGDELQRLSETLNDMLQRLEAAFHRITQFTADASHELRTPIALVRTTAELALHEQRTAADREEAIREILDESERTSELLENLLILARADSGKEALQFSVIDLSALVRETAEQGQKLAAARRLEFQARIEDRAVEVLADPHAIRRLILILLDNAVKYTPQPGRVSVSLSAASGSATIQVQDTGIGIAGEELPHIFERFYRTDKARSRETGGVGLGLAIAQWIAEKHKGRITAQSELGRGTVFQVSLPLAEAAPEKAV